MGQEWIEKWTTYMKGLNELFVKITLVFFEDVLRQEKYVTIHRRNIQSLAVELFKVKQYL